ncbi:MAG: hypothetical protein ACOYL1_04660 [Chlamydiia bacterium]|jgi:hypothetical protein
MNFSVFLSLLAISGVTIFQSSLEANQTRDSSQFPLLSLIDEGDFYSQVSQDKFVYSILYGLLGKQDKGYYLEIGAGEPIHINNSYFFEKNLHWDGVSIDISENLAERWYAARKNLLLSEDATQSDYSAILRSFPRVIDYLSLDVDGSYDVVLEKLVRAKHIFKVITIEHDFYRYGDLYRQKERKILTGLGYHLLCSDVSQNGCAFEDWWIHPDFFPSEILSQLASLDLRAKNYIQIMQVIRAVVQSRQ